MSSKSYTDLVQIYREKLGEQGITPLSDEAVGQVAGGVGGNNEATCPYCTGSITMNKISSPGCDDYWVCPNCGMLQILSDAETIQMIEYFEKIGYTDFEYPSWWSQLQKSLR